MEIVRKYLEQRVEQLHNQTFHDAVVIASINELEQVLTLFNEEYEKHNKNLDRLACNLASACNILRSE